jgi:mono/diheme cytochrome c family protein
VKLKSKLFASAVVLLTAAVNAASAAEPPANAKSIERGKYLVKIAGCNDCHTAGYAQSGGTIPEKQWLTGDALGWRGPWGTTYPTNLRLYMQKLSESDWVKLSGTAKFRPPMPWFNLHAMTADDRRAIYHYVKSMGAAGEPAPAFVPPDREPKGPAIRFPAPPG